tara:strand:+ start:19307 stop:22237 length:2931 start_codon:yes stop_codon:yes gene_type:complete
MRCFKYVCIFYIFFLSEYKFVYAQNSTVFFSEDTYWVDSVLSELSDDEKIAQLLMVAAYSNKDENHKTYVSELIKKYKIGGLMFLQGGPVRQAKLTNYYQSISKTPLMIAIDAEWGVAMRLDSCLRFPWQMTLGATIDKSLIYEMGVEIARQCKLLGIHINFAPVVDVNSNPNNPIINNRSFGENPVKVGELSTLYMKGMQDNNVLACAKHFPGHGDTDDDSHKTLPVVEKNKTELENVELLPYKMLIDSGLGSIMTAHLHIPSLDNTKDLAVSLSKKVVEGLLKNEMGFKGLAITDALNMKGVSQFYKPGEVDVMALLAGNDVLLFAEDVPKAIENIKLAIKQKKISQDEINARCKKVLMAKKWMGLNKYEPVNLERISQKIITNNTEVINRKLVQSSLTLLQNYDDLLPLQNLDTLNIASVCIGENTSVFQQVLSKYTKVTHFKISDNASSKEQALLLNKLSEFNLVIASVHKSNSNPWKSYKINRNTDVFLQSVAMQSKVILTIFANPYSLNSLFITNNFDALVLSYQNSEIAQDKTAQAIFGGFAFKGKIPVSTKHFNLDQGIKTYPIRMRYVTPEEINFKSENLYKIDSIVKSAISEKATPGCQVLIAKDGNVFFDKAYGFHTYQKKNPVLTTDIYDVASVTKIVATIPLLMKMVDSGFIDLEKTLGDYLDLDSTNKDTLVLRHILAHQSALKPWIPFYLKTLNSDSTGLFSLRDTLYSDIIDTTYTHQVANNLFLHNNYPDSIIDQIVQSDLLNKSKYKYSDLGYYFFKKIIEDYYQLRLDKILESKFYTSIGMESLGYNPLKRIDSSRIVPTELDFIFRSQLLKGYVHDQGAAMQGGVGGHAGIFANANDLAKIMQMYLQDGEYANQKYISKKTLKEFTKCQFPEDDNRRGAGFDKPVLDDKFGGPTCKGVSKNSFGHSGFTGTLVWADPNTNIIYVFLSNRIHPDAENKKLIKMNIRTEIMKVIYDSI